MSVLEDKFWGPEGGSRAPRRGRLEGFVLLMSRCGKSHGSSLIRVYLLIMSRLSWYADWAMRT